MHCGLVFASECPLKKVSSLSLVQRTPFTNFNQVSFLKLKAEIGLLFACLFLLLFALSNYRSLPDNETNVPLWSDKSGY